jgi:RHS repeat-associated protein
VHSFAVDGSTNRIIGVNYDANGNQNGTAGWAYDVMNRLKAYNTSEYYGYLPSNKRVWHRTSSYVEKVYYYDITGQRIGEYQVNYNNGSLKLIKLKENYYFAGKLIRSGDEAVAMDRLASVRWRKNLTTQVVTTFDYYPYGEEKPSATANERDKFATYMRDATGLDYADQRYFNSTWGRFVSVDPFVSIENPYPYANADPVIDRESCRGPIGQSFAADVRKLGVVQEVRILGLDISPVAQVVAPDAVHLDPSHLISSMTSSSLNIDDPVSIVEHLEMKSVGFTPQTDKVGSGKILSLMDHSLASNVSVALLAADSECDRARFIAAKLNTLAAVYAAGCALGCSPCCFASAALWTLAAEWQNVVDQKCSGAPTGPPK